MRSKTIFPLLVLFSLIAAGFTEEKFSPRELNHLLKEELNLAKTPSLYFIFDLKGKSIRLKSRGMILQEWPIESVYSWGVQPSLKALTVVKKSALFAPQRKKITPGAAEQQGSKFELEALELKDMPSAYSLYLSEGIYLYIRPKSKTFVSRVASIGHFFNWYLWVPLRNLRFELKKQPFAAIDVKLKTREDAQGLYWSFADGIKGFILFP